MMIRRIHTRGWEADTRVGVAVAPEALEEPGKPRMPVAKPPAIAQAGHTDQTCPERMAVAAARRTPIKTPSRPKATVHCCCISSN